MFEAIATHIQALPVAVQLVGLCAVLAIGDFLMGVAASLKPPNTFHGTLFGRWIVSKGLPIVVISLLYGLDTVIKVVTLDVGGVDLGIFGLTAYGMAITFIAQEVMSIIKNAKLFQSDPVETPAEENPTPVE